MHKQEGLNYYVCNYFCKNKQHNKTAKIKTKHTYDKDFKCAYKIFAFKKMIKN